ncbi:MAG TPA: glycosyltransferase family 2 protein [Anaerolineae bacterium]|nr:glycosyltransferase family 2 protein [Anaerolineae bacterium]
MPTISVIIPIYNRRNNLRLCLAALDKQGVRDFEVILCDDGSQDDPLAVFHEFDSRFQQRYVWHERRGVQIALCRNEGSAIAHGKAFLFLDSDVLLNPSAIGHYLNIHAANPDVIVVGRYDWLPPQLLTAYDVHHNWEQIIHGEMTPMDIGGLPQGILGIDPRLANPNLFNSSVVHYGPYCLSMFSGNLLVPRAVFFGVERYDSQMVGHGGEDAEFGMRAQLKNVPVIFSDEVVGYHVYHTRDQPKNEEELVANAKYIEEKHDLAALGVRRGDPGESILEYRKDVGHV